MEQVEDITLNVKVRVDTLEKLLPEDIINCIGQFYGSNVDKVRVTKIEEEANGNGYILTYTGVITLPGSQIN